MCSTPTAGASTQAAVVASALLSPAEKLAQIKAWVADDAACGDSVAEWIHATPAITPAAKSAYGARTPVAMIPETPGPSTRGRPKSFLEKMLQLRHAPRELFIIFSIKFAESTAYYAFSYVYVAFLSEEFDFSDVEAGVLYTLYGLLCSVIGLLAGPLIDAIDLRTALLIGTIPSFLGRFGSADSLENIDPFPLDSSPPTPMPLPSDSVEPMEFSKTVLEHVNEYRTKPAEKAA